MDLAPTISTQGLTRSFGELMAVDGVNLRVAPGLSGLPRLSARLGLAASALLIPTLLMGGTLPVLMRHLTERLNSARRELSIL